MVASSNFFFGSSGFYPYEIGQSCRFESASDERLSRAPSSAGNKKTFTMSCWVKRSATSSSALFSSGTEATELTQLSIQGDGNLRFRDRSGDNLRKETTALLNDVGAWYHIVCAVDLTQASNGDRVKLYINGTLQTDLSINDTFSNRNTYINRTGGNGMVVGERAYDTANSLSGYLAEVHFIDGTQVTADSFGETKEGVWIPKEYTGGSYGTNGFYLKFDQTGTGTASASTIGADSSGNDNHLTSTNLASIDSNRTDSPTNNFATWNPEWAGNGTYGTHGTIVNGALELSSVGSETNAFCSQILPSSGKYYVEMRVSSLNSFSGGVMQTAPTIHRSVLFQTDGTIDQDNSQVQSGLGSFSAGDTIGIRCDMDAGTVQFYVEDSAYGSAVTLTSIDNQGEYAIMCRANAYVELRTDTKDMEFSIPNGYTTLSTANYPEPTISPLNAKQPLDYFNTVLYTGNGSSQNVSGLSFQPDWVWIKSRSSANKHKLYDAVRGVQKTISSSGTDAESTELTTLTEFRSDGFAVGSNDGVNKNTDSMVAWNWLGANGTTTNDASATGVGSIDSVYSANTTAGFSIVSYTGTGSNGTVAHGLGVAPKWVIVKKRNNTGDWVVWHEGLGDGTNYIILDTDQAGLTATNIWNSTIPTSSVFSVGTHTTTNGSSDTFIAYCFAEIEGYSKFGKFTGNGDADGPFVYTGFRPAWLMWKRTNSTNQWVMNDATRNPFNQTDQVLYANLNDADSTGEGIVTNLVSNGFKLLSSTAGNANTNNSTYIYMAFAEMPFKYANAR